MDWISTIADRWMVTLAWLAGLAAAFGVLARLSPCNPGMYWWRDLRAVATDVVYWFVVPLVMLVGRTALLVAVAVIAFGGPPPASAVTAWPLWQQAVAVLLLQDFLLYWLHRLFHTRPAWPFHAIHHSPRVLDWTSLSRFHPVNQLLEFTLADVIVLMLGFPPAVLLAVAPFNLVYSAMVHANLNWTFGPLRYVFASPVFHRWHHTSETEGLDKNFAPTFPFLDLLFGTFYMPTGKVPVQFGAGNADVPAGFWGQLVYPFRGMKPVGWIVRRPGVALTAGLLIAVGAYSGWPYVAARFATPTGLAESRREASPLSGVGVERHPIVTAIAMSDDGSLVVYGDENGVVRIRDLATGRAEAVPGKHGRRVTGVKIAADSRRVVSCGADGTIRIWVRGEAEVRTLPAHRGGVASVALSSNGPHIVSGGADGTVRVWDADGHAEVTLAAGGAITSVSMSADGQRITAGLRRVAKVWDSSTDVEVILRGHTDMVAAVVLTPNGTRTVTGGFDGLVKVWDADTGQELLSLAGHHGPVAGVAVSSDGQLVVSGGADGIVRLWNTVTGKEIVALAGHTRGVTGVAINADGHVAVSSGRDGTIRVWDTRKREPRTLWELAAPGAK